MEGTDDTDGQTRRASYRTASDGRTDRLRGGRNGRGKLYRSVGNYTTRNTSHLFKSQAFFRSFFEAKLFLFALFFRLDRSITIIRIENWDSDIAIHEDRPKY